MKEKKKKNPLKLLQNQPTNQPEKKSFTIQPFRSHSKLTHGTV